MIRETRIVMGMPVTVEIANGGCESLVADVFAYFEAVDHRFSPFKPQSELGELNSGSVAGPGLSAEMREVLALAARTFAETRGYFDVRRPDGRIDPSGIVKGWAIRNAARLIEAAGVQDFMVDAGGDVQSRGRTADGDPWTIGIRNPFDAQQIIKAVRPCGRGIATSGTYARGQHIYDPHRPGEPITDVVSLTVIGPDVLEADRFATAAFAMGKAGIQFVEAQPQLEGYIVDRSGIATQTSGFKVFVAS